MREDDGILIQFHVIGNELISHWDQFRRDSGGKSRVCNAVTFHVTFTNGRREGEIPVSSSESIS